MFELGATRDGCQVTAWTRDDPFSIDEYTFHTFLLMRPFTGVSEGHKSSSDLARSNSAATKFIYEFAALASHNRPRVGKAPIN